MTPQPGAINGHVALIGQNGAPATIALSSVTLALYAPGNSTALQRRYVRRVRQQQRLPRPRQGLPPRRRL